MPVRTTISKLICVENTLDKLNPFLPGDGQLPPMLSGREPEQAALLDHLGHLKANRAPPRNLILIGPRGNGKTALLRWFEQQCGGIEAVWLTPKSIPDLHALAEHLIMSKFMPASFTLGLGGFVRSIWRPGRNPGAFVKRLAASCRRQPLVVLLDEAHNLGSEVGAALLNASQEVRGGGAPFLLVLAGTPELQQRFHSMDATFWNRCTRLGVGRLSAAATVEALARPLEQHGITLTPAALEHSVSDSQHYPYFIQVWGEALWRHAYRSSVRQLTLKHAQAVQPQVDAVREAYYADYFDELLDAALVPAARTLAQTFREQPRLAEFRLLDAIAGQPVGLTPSAETLAQRQTLQHLGYIWKPPGAEKWEPGIPSLMDYVFDNAPAPPAT